MEQKHYLVTGGAGFIGSHLVDLLLERNHQVTVIDDFSSGHQHNLAQHEGNQNLVVVKRDINEDLAELFAKPIDAVLHLAALPRVQYSIHYPQKTHRMHVEGTVNLLEACRQAKVNRFVFASSCSVYGDQTTLPLTETMVPQPVSPYALHKLVGEQYLSLYHSIYNMQTVSLRFFNVFGPRQDPSGEYGGLICTALDRTKKNEPLIINGDGQQTRDYVYVNDVARAIMKAGEETNEKLFGQVINIGTGNERSVNDVVATLQQQGASLTATHGPAVIEPQNSVASIDKAAALLGWQPHIAFDEGLKTTIDSFLT